MKPISNCLLFRLMSGESPKLPQTCEILAEKIDAVCNLMYTNLSIMSALAKGGMTTDLIKFIRANFPFIGHVCYLSSIASRVKTWTSGYTPPTPTPLPVPTPAPMPPMSAPTTAPAPPNHGHAGGRH